MYKALVIGGIIAMVIIGISSGQGDVSPTPKSFFIKVGEENSFTYWNHNISVNYLSANPQRVVVKVDENVIKDINKSIDDFPRGVYWNSDNLRFELKPVIWRVNEEGKKIPYYEETWNTTELLFEVRYTGDGSIKKSSSVGIIIAITIIIASIITNKKIRREKSENKV